MKFFIILFLPLALFASSLHDAVKSLDKEAVSRALLVEDINELQEGETALGLAIQASNMDIIYQLIQAGINVNLGKPSPITKALKADNSEMAALLLDNNADLPDGLGISGRGLIYDLLLQRHYNITGFLLEQGLDFPKKGKLNTFSLALSFAPLSLIETFIDHDVDLNYRDLHLDRPLDIALRLQRHDVVKLLIDKKVDVHDASFLEIAISHNDKESLALLVEAGCSIDIARQNLLILAVKYGSLEILQELSRAGARINYSKNKQTALTEAVKYKKKDIVLWLLDSQLDPLVHEQAIFPAISQGDLAMVALLVEKNVGLDAKNSQGLTPLLYANKTKQFEIAKYLLGVGVDSQAKDNLGENALFKSIRFFQHDMLDALLLQAVDLEATNRSKLTPLNFSIAIGNFKAFKKLLEAGAVGDEESLQLSVSKGYERFYIRLKEKFILNDVLDNKKNTLLHLAAKTDRHTLLKRLLLDGMDYSLTNDRGNTPLHIAAKEGFKTSCSLLLNFDANITAINDRDHKAMNLAFKFNHPKLGKWLENYQAKLEEELKAKELLEREENNSTLMMESDNVTQL